MEMTGSTMSAAALMVPQKTPHARVGPQRDPAGDLADHPGGDFDAAFEAIRQYNRDTGRHAPPALPDGPADAPADHWQLPIRDRAAWVPIPDGMDAPPAAGDLLLTGGALTPESDDAELDVQRQAIPVGERPPMEDSSEAASADTPPAAPIAGPATDARKPDVAAERPNAARAPAPEAGSAGPAPSDPFDELRHLVRTVDNRPAPAKPPAAASAVTADPDTPELRAPEPVPTERPAANPPAADRPNRAVVREIAPPQPASNVAIVETRQAPAANTAVVEARQVPMENIAVVEARQVPAVNVTVVEARQTPALAMPQTNISAVVGAISGNTGWSAALRGGEAISTGLSHQPGAPLQVLKIQLHPAELGSVNAVLRISGDQLAIELKVETIEAYRQLSDSQNTVLKALKGQGYAIEQISIQQAAPDRPVPQQALSFGQGNGQSAGGAYGQPGHDDLARSGDGGSGQQNTRDDSFERGRPGSEDSPAGQSSRIADDGAVYL